MTSDSRTHIGSDTAHGYPALIAYTGVGEAELRDAIAEGSLDADVDSPTVGYRVLEQWLRARNAERLLADPQFFDQRVDLSANVNQAS